MPVLWIPVNPINLTLCSDVRASSVIYARLQEFDLHVDKNTYAKNLSIVITF